MLNAKKHKLDDLFSSDKLLLVMLSHPMFVKCYIKLMCRI